MTRWCLLLLLAAVLGEVQVPRYDFKVYHFKSKSRYLRNLRQLESECESRCARDGPQDSIAHLACTRKCESKECYQELYGADEVMFTLCGTAFGANQKKTHG
eukprot:m.95600 g.95600  ORF g.95600 m.95600 type:complete len:102 (+) comp8607_c0_seq4:2-307(+)